MRGHEVAVTLVSLESEWAKWECPRVQLTKTDSLRRARDGERNGDSISPRISSPPVFYALA